MIPKKFQSFILPQHKRAVFGAAVAKREDTSLLYDAKQQAYTGKKRGPKKHGPIAKILKQRLKGDYDPIPKGLLPAWNKLCALFYDTHEQMGEYGVYIGEDEPHYELMLCMAYAIALDQGV